METADNAHNSNPENQERLGVMANVRQRLEQLGKVVVASSALFLNGAAPASPVAPVAATIEQEAKQKLIPSLLTVEQQRFLSGFRMDPSMPGDARIDRGHGEDIVVVLNGITYNGSINAQGELLSMRIDNRTVRFAQPIVPQNIVQVTWNSVRALRHMEAAGKTIRLPQTDELDMQGGSHIYLTTEQDGVGTDYMATPDGFFRITDEAPLTQQEREEMEKLRKEINRIDDMYSDWRGVDNFLRGEINWPLYLDNFEDFQHEQRRKTLLQEIARVQIMNSRLNALIDRADSTVLQDTRNGDRRYGQFSRNNAQFLTIRSYDTASREVSSIRYDNGHVQLRVTTQGNSRIRLSSERGNSAVSVLDETTRESYGRSTRANGSPVEIWRGRDRDHYTEAGQLDYRTNEAGHVFMRSSNGTLFDATMVTLEGMRTHVRTREEFFRWEQRVGNDLTNYEHYPQLRAHGLELCGLTKRLAALQEFCPVNINRTAEGYDLCSVELLSQRLALIEQIIRHYPPGYFQRMGLREIRLVSGSGSTSEASLSVLGGRLSPTDRIVIIPLNRPPENIRISTHHEIGHAVHFANAGWARRPLAANWWWRESGEPPAANDGDYARVYGRTNPMEDFATVSENLHTREAAIAIRARAQNQPVLAMKIREIERMYYVTSNGRIDAQYWQDITRGVEINAQYWQNRGENFQRNPAWEKERESWAKTLEERRQKEAKQAPR